MATANRSSAAPDEQSPTSYVYVMTGRPGAVKVGFSSDTQARRRALQAQVGHDLSVAFQLPVVARDASAVEVQAHWILRDYRVEGEWFAVTARAAASAIRRAHAQVKKGVVGGERGRAPARRVHGSDDPLVLMYTAGKLTEAQYGAGRLYQRARQQIVGTPSRIRGSYRCDAEGVLDIKIWLDAADADIRRKHGEQALHLMRAVLFDGHRLQSDALRHINSVRVRSLLCAALDEVAERPAFEPLRIELRSLVL